MIPDEDRLSAHQVSGMSTSTRSTYVGIIHHVCAQGAQLKKLMTTPRPYRKTVNETVE